MTFWSFSTSAHTGVHAMNPSRDAGLRRLEFFLPGAGSDYQQLRNFDFGPQNRDNVSMLSPWVRRRVLLEHEVLDSVIQRHGTTQAEKFIDEVFWRAYFRGWLAHRTSVWTDYATAVGKQTRALETDAELASRVRDAEAGNTGNPAFDTWVKELVTGGYLHNHARMWFASIWVFTLRLPWTLGADFFLRHLLDGDPASNTLSWRWVSGLHTRGKTYLAQRDNILKFTDGRLDPGPGLASKAHIPDDPCASHAPDLRWPQSPPAPDVHSAWLLTDEDATAKVTADHLPVIALQATAGLSAREVSPMVSTFVKGCLDDALQRHRGERGVFQNGYDFEELLIRLTGKGVNNLHCFHVPYGPTADALLHLEHRLARESIRLHRHVRPYDAAVWPETERGFFRLKRRIPFLLDAMGLAEHSHA